MLRRVSEMARVLAVLLVSSSAIAQTGEPERRFTMYDVPPRWLVDLPTAGTLPRGHYNLGIRIYPYGGGLGYCDIGLSSRFMLGISYGGEKIVSAETPNWNNRIGFSLKFRPIDELEYFPAISLGYSDQGYGAWNKDFERYSYKSRGFYAVASRSFYFYRWTSGWHIGVNYSLEGDKDKDEDLNVFGGLEATFEYNVALMVEFDAALNDNRGSEDVVDVAGKGRGYLNTSVKWLFTENLELEVVLKDLLVNRRESDTFTREIRMTFIDSF